MNLQTFEQSVDLDQPPQALSAALTALWWDAKQDWDTAHRHVASEDSRDAAWVHAYLHRKEGDLGNAAYWYRVAGKPVGEGNLAAEWKTISGALLARP